MTMHTRLFRWMVLVCLVVLGARLSSPAQAQGWHPIGPDYGSVLVLAHQPGNNAVVLAGTYFGGLYRSVDWGYNWVPLQVPFASSAVFSLDFDRLTPSRAYAGVYGSGVWRTDDGGLTWVNRSTGLNELIVQSVRADPLVAQRVMAATATGVYISNNAGQSWTPVAGLAGLHPKAIAFDPLRVGVVYLGSIGNGIWRSVDGGQNWVSIGPNPMPPVVAALTFDAAGSLYAATDTGVLQWKSGATAWVDLSFDLPRQFVSDVFAHPTVPNLIFASTGTGVFAMSNWAQTPNWFQWTHDGARFTTTDSQGLLFHVAGEIGSMQLSNNFGASWTRADYGMQTAFIGGMGSTMSGNGRRLIAATELGVMTLDDGSVWANKLPLREGVFDILAKGNAVYAGMETTGVWKSSDGGDTWATASNGIAPARVTGLGQTIETKPQLLAATSSGAYRSNDGGRNWSAIQLPEISYVHTIAADPVRPPIIYLGSGGGRVYKSLNGGKNFEFAGGNLPDEDIVQLVHAPWSGVYAVTATGKLYLTVDNGVSWYPAQNGCPSKVLAVAVDPQRSWIVYLATAGGGLCKSVSGGQQWSAINSGVDNPFVNSLWINPANPQQLWAGSVGVVYRSDDSGATWRSMSQGLPAGIVTALVGDPTNATHMLAIVYGSGVYRSQDSGATWTLRSDTPASRTALSLRYDAAQAGRVFRGTTRDGVQVSQDAGLNWQSSNNGMSLFVRSIAADPASSSTLYAGTLGGGVFRSRDAAASWVNVGLNNGNVFRVRSPVANQVLVGTSNGVMASIDGGDNWAHLGQSESFVFSMVTDPLNPMRVIGGGTGGRVWTTTGGANWQEVGAGLPRTDVLAMSLCSDGTLYAAPEQSGVWKTALGSLAPWQNPGGAGLENTRIARLACDPRSGVLYAGTNGKGVLLSNNGGVGWTPINSGLDGNIVSAVVPSPINAWEVWTALQDGSVFRSGNAGLQWQAMRTGLPPTGGVNQLVLAVDGAAYAATVQGIYWLAPGNTTWVRRSDGLPSGTVSTLWADPERSSTVYAAVAGSGLHRSTNSGVNWSPVSSDPTSADIVSMAGGSGRIYASTAGTGMVWSDDAGAHFSQAQAPQSIPQVVTDVVVDLADGGAIYAATGGQGVLTSRDGGARWTSVSNGLGIGNLLCLVVHPQRSRELYACTNDGVFVTRDAGANWHDMNQGLWNRNATSLAFDSLLPDVLYVGIEGGGIFYHDTRP